MSTEKSYMPIIVGILALVLVGGGFLYMQNTAPVSDTEPLTTDAENTATPSNETTEVTPSEVTASGELEAEVVAETKPATDTPRVTPEPVVTKPVTPVTPAVTTEPVKPVASPAPTSQYKNGTYTVDGNYRSPEGGETIGITLTIKDDFIVDAVAILQARDKQSIKYQNLFINNFKTLVVGKKLSEVNLGKVSGSSLTPKGFNEAVVEIRTKAKV